MKPQLIQIRRSFLQDREFMSGYIDRVSAVLGSTAVIEKNVFMEYVGWDEEEFGLPQVPEVVEFNRRLFRKNPLLLRKLDEESLHLVRIMFHDIEAVEHIGDGKVEATASRSAEWELIATMAGVPII